MPGFSSIPINLTFFFNDTPTTEIYTLSLHDALPISARGSRSLRPGAAVGLAGAGSNKKRSEEHTSELQSHLNLVCRLRLEKKKKEKQVQRCLKKKKNKNKTHTSNM